MIKLQETEGPNVRQIRLRSMHSIIFSGSPNEAVKQS